MVENDIRPTAEDGAAPSAEAELIPLLTDYLDDLSERTAERVGNNAGVAVTLSVDGAPFTIGASTALARDVDLIQYRIGTGPCLNALHHGVGMYVPDLGSDDRWGEYGPQAAARGAASCVSVPVFVGDRPAAVVKIYSSEIDGLTAEQQAVAIEVGPEVAGGVGLAKHLTRQAQQLDDRIAAMTTRRSIDVAIGVLMQQQQCSANTAFGMLRNTSQTQNKKIRDVAEELISAFPGTGAGPAPFRERQPPE
ncbi:MAG: GAF and ANTAR domain-containing protein [Nakamurella sp.]